LQPGTYTSAETVPAGWVLSNIVCTGQSASTVTIGASGGFDAGDTGVSIALVAGENVNCTFTNTKNGSITITKVIQGGTGTFTFTGTPSGTISTNNGTVTATALQPATYTASETVPAGWVLTNIVCTGQDASTVTIGASGGFDAGDTGVSINLAAGENVNCTFTNTLKPDLTITKTNDVSGTVAVGTPFNWTLTVTNSSNGLPATFTDGQKIITDQLPTTGATYGSVSVVAPSGITGTGTISCAIVSNTLTCSASGGTVIIAAGGGTFGAKFSVTPTGGGSLVNPRTEGTCAVDPDGSISESNEGNNGCGDTVTVTKVDPTVTTTIHDASHSPVIAVKQDTIVHDSATVTGNVGTPTGTVTFSFFNNGSCTGTAAQTSGTFTLTSGTVDGTTFTQSPPNIGSVAFRATYNGDSAYNSKTGDCEPLSVVSKATTVSITTTLSGGGSSGTQIVVGVGQPVTDVAVLNGAQASTASGTVTYRVYTDNACQNLFASGGTKAVTNGIGAASDPVTFNQVGTFFWQIEYSGDSNNIAALSNCTDEQVAIAGLHITLTPLKDSFMRLDAPNTNEGANRRLRLAGQNFSDSFLSSVFAPAPKKQKKLKGGTATTFTIPALPSSAADRPLAAFNVNNVSLVGFVKAVLVYNIATNNGGWGGGQAVEVRRITTNWTEGNGKNPDLGGGTNAVGTNSGVTWNCAIDTNIASASTNCASPWGGGDAFMAAHNNNVPNVIITNSSSGDVVWDVTDDVLKIAGDPQGTAIKFGWVVKKVDETATGGDVLFYSKEGAIAASNANVAPRLIFFYQ
jgi:hypothetical protein